MYERLKNLDHEVCNCVRWKSMYYRSDPDLSVPPSNAANYWCAMTQRVIGPDGEIVDLEDCKPGRACFKEGF